MEKECFGEFDIDKSVDDFMKEQMIKNDKKNEERLKELMREKGIMSVIDIATIIRDSFGNVLDIKPVFKEADETFNQYREKLECEPVEKKEDNVNHPSHYISENGLETIDVIQAFGDIEGFCIGNALKYICRWKNKNGIEDLKKAVWYLNKIISVKEGEC